MVTLGDVFLIDFTEKELHLNRDGEMSEKQYLLFREHILFGDPRIVSKRPRTRLFMILAIFTLGPVLLVPVHGGLAALISVVSVLVFIFGQVAKRQFQIYEANRADVRSGEVWMTEGVPQVIFEGGTAFIEVDGVKLRAASANLALQFKAQNTQDVHRVYYAPNTKVALSYEKLDNTD